MAGSGSTAWAADSQPTWMIGRAYLQKAEGGKDFILELDLRNKGAVGDLPVEVLARWRARGEAVDDAELILLGRYHEEVVWKKTARFMIFLDRLGPLPPVRGSFLEVKVLTGTRETDRQLVFLP